MSKQKLKKKQSTTGRPTSSIIILYQNQNLSYVFLHVSCFYLKSKWPPRKLPSDLATVWLRATAAFLGRTWSRPRVRSVKSLNGNIMFCSCLFYSKFIQHIEFLVSDFQHVCNFHMTSWKTIPFSTAMQKRHLSLARRQIHIAQVLCQDQTKFTTQVLNHSEHHRFRYVIPMTSWASAWKKKLTP